MRFATVNAAREVMADRCAAVADMGDRHLVEVVRTVISTIEEGQEARGSSMATAEGTMVAAVALKEEEEEVDIKDEAIVAATTIDEATIDETLTVATTM